MKRKEKQTNFIKNPNSTNIWYGKIVCPLMEALSERNVLKASEYYITFCNRFINWGNIISSTVSKYLL